MQRGQGLLPAVALQAASFAHFHRQPWAETSGSWDRPVTMRDASSAVGCAVASEERHPVLMALRVTAEQRWLAQLQLPVNGVVQAVAAPVVAAAADCAHVLLVAAVLLLRGWPSARVSGRATCTSCLDADTPRLAA